MRLSHSVRAAFVPNAVDGTRGEIMAATVAVDRSVLVVDDDRNICDLVAAILKFHRYVAKTSTDAFEGLWRLRERPVGLLITDVEMPVCGGRELAQRARDLWPNLPILFMTGGAAEPDNDDLQVLEPPWDLLHKPFSLAHLMDSVEHLLPPPDSGRARRAAMSGAATQRQVPSENRRRNERCVFGTSPCGCRAKVRGRAAPSADSGWQPFELT